MNSSSVFLDHTCHNAELYASSGFIAFSNFAQIFFAVLSLGSLLINFLRYKKGKLVLHKNLRIIIWNAVFLYFIHSISTIMVQLRHQIKFFTYTHPCDLLMSAWSCFLIRDPINFSVIGFTVFHVVLCIERSSAIISPAKYESSGSFFGVLCTIVLWTSNICWNLYIFLGEDFNHKIAYCVLSTATNNYKWSIEFSTLMVIDIVVLIIDIVITLVNKKSLNKRLEKAKYRENNLGRAYQLNENARTMKIILPLSIAHSIIFVLFLALTVLVRVLFTEVEDPMTFWGLVELCNTIPCIYTLIIPLVYLRLRRNLAHKNTQIVPMSNQTDTYFQLFNASIHSNSLRITEMDATRAITPNGIEIQPDRCEEMY